MLLGLDAYAWVYFACLLTTLVLAKLTRDRARIEASCVLMATWFATVSMQVMAGHNVAPMAFSLVDIGAVFLLGMIAFLYDRIWSWAVAGFHVVMMFGHAAIIFNPSLGQFEYLSFLAALGYASMLVVAFPSALQLVGYADYDRRIDYHRFMRGGRLSTRDIHAPKIAKAGAG